MGVNEQILEKVNKKFQYHIHRDFDFAIDTAEEYDNCYCFIEQIKGFIYGNYLVVIIEKENPERAFLSTLDEYKKIAQGAPQRLVIM